MNNTKTNINVQLLNEGLVTARPAEALYLGEGKYEILMPKDYDPEDEKWEFEPGTIVRCENVIWDERSGKTIFLAVEKVG